MSELGNESLLAGRGRIIDRGGLGYELFSGTEITRDRKRSLLFEGRPLSPQIASEKVTVIPFFLPLKELEGRW